ncbi:MAG: iron-sulfur cluster assembly scaffold protein [bacterium]|nr:iron-sulfur cluster assembly scaffold protein [bacterium]
MSSTDLYREELLEHYRNPQNFGRLKTASFSAHKLNPLCGDDIRLQMATDKKGKIIKVKFSGSGCVLSIASASMLTEQLKGRRVTGLKRIKPQTVLDNFPVPPSPARKKCALLIFDALQEISNKNF